MNIQYFLLSVHLSLSLLFTFLLEQADAISKTKTEREMSSAMKMYLQRKRDHDMFISKERAEFEIGKAHLASMMGLEAATLEQSDIDRSIEYLFPSGLAAEARPVMKPPEEIYPRQKEAEFDMEGRPFHPFFYTLKPHYYEAVYKLRDHMEAVTIFGDRLARQGKGPDPEQVLNAGKLADTRWATQAEVSTMCLESVSEAEYNDMLAVLNRLTHLPFSYRVKEDIFAWRVKEGTAATQQLFIPPQFDETGRAWVQFVGMRKTSLATVKVTKPGEIS
jgi:small subunit ribosomal protein S9